MTRGGATSPFAVAHLPIDELRPDPANPRRIDEAELDALERSLRQFGARERREAWRLWRSVVDGLADDVRVETEGRAELERRYLGGHPVLFADAATAWAGQVEQVERLARLAEVIRPSESRRPTKRASGGESIKAPVDALATWLADDARVKAYEILGERERAVSIMERRLRA